MYFTHIFNSSQLHVSTISCSLLLWRYKSDSLGLLENILHLRWSCTCSAHFISFIFFRSFLTSSSHRDLGLPAGLPMNGFHLCILFTVLVSGFLFMYPNQLSLRALTQFIMFRCLTNSPNSLFVLILQIPQQVSQGFVKCKRSFRAN